MATLGSSPTWNAWQQSVAATANVVSTSGYTMPGVGGVATAVVIYVGNAPGYSGASYYASIWEGSTLVAHSAATSGLPTGSPAAGGQSWQTLSLTSPYFLAGGTSYQFGWQRTTGASSGSVWSSNTGGTGYTSYEASPPGNLGSTTTVGAPGAYVIYTPVAVPTATTDAATSIMLTSATLNATFNDGGMSAAGGGATDWYLYYSTSNTGPWTLAGSGTFSGTSVAEAANITGLTGSTTYYFYATCTNAVGTVSGSTLSFETADTPNAPTLTSPANGVTENLVSSGTTFDWTYNTGGASGGQTKYALQVQYNSGASYWWTGSGWSSSSTFITSSSGSVTIGATYWSSTYWTPAGGTFTWTVATQDANGTGPYASAFTLISEAVPSAPTLLGPINGAQEDVSGTPTFTWQYNATTAPGGQTAFAFRHKLSGGSYSYWDVGTSTFGGSVVWNTSTAQSITFPSGSWSNNTTSYDWSVATEDAGGQGVFASDFVLTGASAPVVTVTAPTGDITATEPVVEWTVIPTSGASQIAYAVNTFTAAQQAIPGFDPERSPYTDASGTVSSSSPTYQIATPLAPGEYYSYVDITQTGNQDNAYNAYTTFTVEADVPPTPTLTAIYGTDPTTGYPVIQLSATAELNILSAVDSSFETGTGTYVPTNCTLSRSNTYALDGLYSLKMTIPSNADISVESGLYAVTGGQNYSAMVSLYAALGYALCVVSIEWYTSAGAHISTTSATPDGIGSNTWTQLTLTNVTAPSNAAKAAISWYIPGGETTYPVWADEAGIFPNSTTDWSLGGFLPTAGIVITRSDGLYVRNASTGTPLALNSQQEASVYDYECTPGVAYSYSAVIQATGSSGTISSAPAIAGASVPLALGFWEIDPTNPSSAVRAQPTQWEPQNFEQSAAHVVLGQVTNNVIASAMQASDFNATFITFTAAIYQGLLNLCTSQKTVFISDPFGFSYYFRLALAPGGLSVGTGNKAHDTQLQASSAAAPYRQITVQGIAQPRPEV